jgi:hypothetical protein
MRAFLVCLVSACGCLAAAAGLAEDPPPAEAVKPEAQAEAFVPPEGWRPKKRGKFTVYCRRQTEMGTRLPKEVCYDEVGIQAMLAAQRDDREKVDQLRRICSSQGHCGSN